MTGPVTAYDAEVIVSWPSFSASVIRSMSLSIRLMERIMTFLGKIAGADTEVACRSPKCPAPQDRRPPAAIHEVCRRPRKCRARRRRRIPLRLAALPDDALLEAVQRQTFRYFWDGAHPASGLAFDRRTAGKRANDTDPITIGGSGFGVMALIVAAERGWVTRAAALERLDRMLDLLAARALLSRRVSALHERRAPATPSRSAARTMAADLVETSFLMMGLLCAREYFDRDSPDEAPLARDISTLWDDVEWDWFTHDGRDVLYWHWSPYNGWAMDHADPRLERVPHHLRARGRRRRVMPSSRRSTTAASRAGPGSAIANLGTASICRSGMAYGGPLFFTHYSFCGLDPRGLKDRYADYWAQNVHHVRINRAHCIANPGKFAGLRRILLGANGQ